MKGLSRQSDKDDYNSRGQRSSVINVTIDFELNFCCTVYCVCHVIGYHSCLG